MQAGPLIALIVMLGIAFPPVPAVGGSRLDGVIISWKDGDTGIVRVKSRSVEVRLIGIDAPETMLTDRLRGQARKLNVPARETLQLGLNARDAAARLAPPGRRVWLETDVERHDRYGRLLAYIWLTDGTMVNEQLLRQGWAQLMTIPPNVSYVERFVSAQQAARRARVGIWASRPAASRPDVPAGRPAPRPTPTAQQPLCHPSYPTVCIPPPPPDLDCADIPHRRFQVVGEDPHRFDGDRDGVGCERG